MIEPFALDIAEFGVLNGQDIADDGWDLQPCCLNSENRSSITLLCMVQAECEPVDENIPLLAEYTRTDPNISGSPNREYA